MDDLFNVDVVVDDPDGEGAEDGGGSNGLEGVDEVEVGGGDGFGVDVEEADGEGVKDCSGLEGLGEGVVVGWVVGEGVVGGWVGVGVVVHDADGAGVEVGGSPDGPEGVEEGEVGGGDGVGAVVDENDGKGVEGGGSIDVTDAFPSVSSSKGCQRATHTRARNSTPCSSGRGHSLWGANGMGWYKGSKEPKEAAEPVSPDLLDSRDLNRSGVLVQLPFRLQLLAKEHWVINAGGMETGLLEGKWEEGGGGGCCALPYPSHQLTTPSSTPFLPHFCSGQPLQGPPGHTRGGPPGSPQRPPHP